MTPTGWLLIDRIRPRPAVTSCPDCCSTRTEVFDTHIGTPGTTAITGTIALVYQCHACHYRAFQADAQRADGIATDAQVATTIRRAAERYTHAARVLTGWTPQEKP